VHYGARYKRKETPEGRGVPKLLVTLKRAEVVFLVVCEKRYGKLLQARLLCNKKAPAMLPGLVYGCLVCLTVTA